MKSIQEHLRQLLKTVSPSKMLVIPLYLDALLDILSKAHKNQSSRCQSKSYISPPKFNY